jgi:hypothetical protein
MKRPSAFGSSSNPSQPVRLLWFFLIFLLPAAPIFYVSENGLSHGDRGTFVQVLWMLAVGLIVSLFCGIAQPIQVFDEDRIIKLARLNLCLAIVDTVLLAILIHDPSSVDQFCQLASDCHTYPVGWLALTGMFYCYAAWCYTTAFVQSR